MVPFGKRGTAAEFGIGRVGEVMQVVLVASQMCRVSAARVALFGWPLTTCLCAGVPQMLERKSGGYGGCVMGVDMFT